VSRSYVPPALRAAVAEQARGRCGYCLTAEAVVGMPMDVEHIIPEALGGSTGEDNLWLACPPCNAHKGSRTSGPDPMTGAAVRFFDPRRQTWGEHFAWSGDGTHILGRTPCGRATALALHLNRPLLVAARREWVAVGWHPPRD
jgi:hypothetical protein